METSIGSEIEDVHRVDKSTAPIKELTEKRDDEIESEALASLKEHPGWIQIEEYIATMKQQTDIVPEVESVRAIGYHALVVRAIKNHLDAIQLMVDANYDYQREKRESGSGEGDTEE